MFWGRGGGGVSWPRRPDAAACGGAGEDAVFAGRARQRDPFAEAAERGREPVEPAGDIGAEMIMVVIPNAHELLVFHRSFPFAWVQPDRKSVVSGKSVSVRVDSGGRRIIKKKNPTSNTQPQ